MQLISTLILRNILANENLQCTYYGVPKHIGVEKSEPQQTYSIDAFVIYEIPKSFQIMSHKDIKSIKGVLLPHRLYTADG